jgi:hypothetical protein
MFNFSQHGVGNGDRGKLFLDPVTGVPLGS